MNEQFRIPVTVDGKYAIVIGKRVESGKRSPSALLPMAPP